LTSIPGVGAIVSLTFTAAIDDPARFKSSKEVGAYFGLTPTKYQSGETDIDGRISAAGSEGGPDDVGTNHHGSARTGAVKPRATARRNAASGL
jgi:hypothetical protein